MGYKKDSELFDQLSGLAKEYNITIWTAAQPQREFSGYQREVRLAPHDGESRYIGFFPMDHTNLIKLRNEKT